MNVSRVPRTRHRVLVVHVDDTQFNELKKKGHFDTLDVGRQICIIAPKAQLVLGRGTPLSDVGLENINAARGDLSRASTAL